MSTYGLFKNSSTFVVLYVNPDIPRLPLVSCTNYPIYIDLFADYSLVQISRKIFRMAISPKTGVAMNDSVDRLIKDSRHLKVAFSARA